MGAWVGHTHEEDKGVSRCADGRIGRLVWRYSASLLGI